MSTPALSLLALLACAAPALAQQPPQDPVIPPVEEEPIGLFVVDARGAMAGFTENVAIGAALGVDAARDLPTRGFGLVVGVHVYPLRRTSWALGLGAEALLRTRGTRTVAPATATAPGGPVIVTSLSAVSPQISMNFGRRRGWSYISGGLGSSRFTVEREDEPFGDPESGTRTINYGGGARWFARKHVALSLDLRFYAISPQQATATRPAYPRMRIMILSAGVSAR